jgi:hypothetical protein
LPVDRGNPPVYYQEHLNAVVAQLVERLLAMQKVVSSNLISRSKILPNIFVILKRASKEALFFYHPLTLVFLVLY